MEKILLTGASSGIGKAIAEKLTAKGYEVIACVRKQEDKEALEALSPQISVVMFDVLDNEKIENLFQEFKSQNISLSAIINAAGFAQAGVMECPDFDAIRKQIEVNAFAPLKIVTTFLPLMKKGRIINISSVSSNFVYPFIAPYCASKKLLDIFFQGLAIERCDENIKFISIKPGVIKTPLWEKSFELAKNAFGKIPPETLEKYLPKTQKLMASLETSIKNGLAPEAVAEKTLYALTVKNPKFSYNVGIGAYVGEFLSKLSVDLQRKFIKISF
ncbi:MAG: SDR family NAD(P)-dependent oxidoreductase [Candidatus Gastranaerophilales bacterium]|nr:SDR family NAD(P)-dependent oxidoreductase [Candidatus Gastranaerophilales bacterium]